MLRLLKRIDWHSNKTWGIIGVVGGFITLLLGILIQPYVTKETQTQILGYLMARTNTIVLAVLGVLFLAVMIRQQKELRLLRKTLSKEEPPKFRRFEQIKTIKYGHIAYRPLLYYDGADNPQGIGVALLTRIFSEVQIEQSNSRALWSNLVTNLASSKYDVVATPIFQTRERSRLIDFCSPMFYSDIGMYVKKDSRILGFLPPNSQTFEEAISMARRMKPSIVAIQGEISGKLALKHLDPKKEDIKEWLTPETASVTSLINAVLGSDGAESEVVFAEVFQAEQTKPVQDGRVINILKQKQLLYPVSFAVRKSDYVLRNYINLRLLEIEETVNDGVLGIILEELRKQPEYANYSMNKIKKYFVRDLQLLQPQSESEDSHGNGQHLDTPIAQEAGQPRIKSLVNHKRKPDPERENPQRRAAVADSLRWRFRFH